VQDLIAFWSYALAAVAFASVVLWRIGRRLDRSDQLLIGACFATAIWAMVAGVCGRTDPMTMTFGNVRNLAWVMLIYEMSGGARRDAFVGLRLVFGAVALAIGLHFALGLFAMIADLTSAEFDNVLLTASILRITASAGALVLVHNVYGQAAPESRVRIRGPMLGLTCMWGYDLNLATLSYFQGPNALSVIELFDLRGAFIAVTAPLFVWTAASGSLRIKLSRAATFQSLSLIGIASYLAVMAILAGALRHSRLSWDSALPAAFFAGLILMTSLLLASRKARGWLKVNVAKHLFEHRYDYRTEWLRFTETLGRAGPDAAPLTERIVKAFADVVDAPGGLLLVSEGARALAIAASWNWAGTSPLADQLRDTGEFWSALEKSGRILELSSLREGWAKPEDKEVPVPSCMADDEHAWTAIPLRHHERLIGIVVLAAPEYRRPLDWEDFDLLRTAGNQAASSLAEALSQNALADAQRFEEFNRRFAFILHDVKNLVSQLSLLSRNAERHADNPDFRADMVATLKISVGKMNELLARLAPHSPAKVQRIQPEPLRPILTGAIAARRGDREVILRGDGSLCGLVDASALEQAVGHLVQNALDASTAAAVTVRVSGGDGVVSIAISDRGVGMDGDFIRNRLFQPFASTKSGGFGIGAFEARSLIRAMGGRISVDSRPGQGTTFTITLPAPEQPTLPASEPQRKRA
jgi:putative PEP-CTERM system histidine kinase